MAASASQWRSGIVATETREPTKIKMTCSSKSHREQEVPTSHTIPRITGNSIQENEVVPSAGDWNAIVAF